MKKKAILAMLLVCAAILSGCYSNATAEPKQSRSITEFMKEKQIPYLLAEVNDNTLNVKLLSNGEEGCTLDDVKAIQAIYEAIHAKTITGEVKNVEIMIENAKGELIYDVGENDISDPIENTEPVAKSILPQTSTLARDLILHRVKSIVSEYVDPSDDYCRIEEAEITDASELVGNQLQMTLRVSNPRYAFQTLQSIYDKLESYSLSENAIVQCRIYVVDLTGICTMYMGGDFHFGNCIAWINPSINSYFVIEEGPRPVEDFEASLNQQ